MFASVRSVDLSCVGGVAVSVGARTVNSCSFFTTSRSISSISVTLCVDFGVFNPLDLASEGADDCSEGDGGKCFGTSGNSECRRGADGGWAAGLLRNSL